MCFAVTREIQTLSLHELQFFFLCTVFVDNNYCTEFLSHSLSVAHFKQVPNNTGLSCISISFRQQYLFNQPITNHSISNVAIVIHYFIILLSTLFLHRNIYKSLVFHFIRWLSGVMVHLAPSVSFCIIRCEVCKCMVEWPTEVSRCKQTY